MDPKVPSAPATLSVIQLLFFILSGKQVQEPISCFIMRKCSHVSSSVVSYFEITNCVGTVSFQKLNHWNLSTLHLWRINSYECSQKWGKSEAGRSLFLYLLFPPFSFFFFFWKTRRTSSSDVVKSALHSLGIHTGKHNVYLEKKNCFLK